MGNSKQYNNIIALGKLLATEMGLDQSTNTLARWMAHHVAEVIQVAESSVGSDKIDAEDRCRELILSLWKHISYFPGGDHPLGELKNLLATISALDPDNKTYFYSLEATSRPEKSELSEETLNWLELARGIDFSARMLIGMCLKRAACDIAEEKHELLKLAEAFDGEQSLNLIVKFVSEENSESTDVLKETERTERARALEIRVTRLKAIFELSQMMVEGLEGEIEDLKS